MTNIIGVNDPYGLAQKAGKRRTRSVRHAKKQIYSSHIKSSICHKLTKNSCRKKNSCKLTKHRIRRTYCRKKTKRTVL